MMYYASSTGGWRNVGALRAHGIGILYTPHSRERHEVELHEGANGFALAEYP